MRSLERLLRPKSIALFGGRAAEAAVRQCDRMGFSGAVWPVHPTHADVHGKKCFRSVADLPAAPDAAFVGINRERTVEIVRELSARGAGGAICYASGFGEAADGVALQATLVAAAGNMPILGPNCYGLINYLDGALLWPDQHGGERVERGVAIVTQSSNIAINMTMQRRGLPIAYVVTAGNQAQTDLSAIAAGLIADSRVTALGLHVEGVGDVAGFEALARRARELGKPIAAIVLGRSAAARAAAVSHTASLSGAAAANAAFFDRLGIARLASIPAFLETLKLLHVHGPLPGGDLCSMSCSGGEAALMADAAAGRGRVAFRALTSDEQARVKAILGDRVAVANPLDYHTFVWGNEAAMANTFAAMIGGFDLSMLVLDFPRADRCGDADWDVAVRAIVEAARVTGGRVAVVATLPENMPEARAEALLAAGIAPLSGIDEALDAAAAAAFIGAKWKEAVPAALHRSLTRPSADAEGHALPANSGVPEFAILGSQVGNIRLGGERGSARILGEGAAKAALAAFGVAVPEGRVVSTPNAAVAAADALGYPVAVKALGIAHKSEAGAVRLNLHDGAAVQKAAGELAGLGTGLLVERMVTDAVAELIVGIVRDPQFGLLMTIGAGGVLVELLGDTASLLLPTSEEEIRQAILSLRTAPLLQGFRGRPAGDLHAAIAAALAIARFAEENATSLEELDVNPLIVRSEGQGAIAVDALIRLRES